MGVNSLLKINFPLYIWGWKPEKRAIVAQIDPNVSKPPKNIS
jgi:hypothetical protein